MENNTTELVFILDKSGSMADMVSDTIGGFNAMIEKQKGIPGTVYVSTVLFSNESHVLHDRIDLCDVSPMTEKEYCVGGCTALIDAIGGAIHHIGNIHKYARPEDVPAHTLFFITTDGMENASHIYSADKVKEMIKRQKEKYGWEFVFVAADIDAIETAVRIGIDASRAANYEKSRKGTEILYQCLNNIVSCSRANLEISDNWSSCLSPEKKQKIKRIK